MKSFTLYHKFVSEDAYASNLRFVCTDNVENVVVYTVFEKNPSSKALEAIINKQKEFAQNRRIKFKNHVVFTKQIKISAPLIRALVLNGFTAEIILENCQEDTIIATSRVVSKLNHNGIPNKLWIGEQSNQFDIYHSFNAEQLPINFIRPVYDGSATSWFDSWLYDKSATATNIFSDIIMMITLQAKSNNCRYSSCLGRTAYVDETQNYYMCPLHIGERTCLGNPQADQMFFDLFETENTYRIINASVEKRSDCAEKCNGFGYCQAGCALEPHFDCGSYIALVEHIGSVLKNIYDAGKIDTVNNVVKNAILNAIAFGSAFFK